MCTQVKLVGFPSCGFRCRHPHWALLHHLSVTAGDLTGENYLRFRIFPGKRSKEEEPAANVPAALHHG